MVTIIGDPDGVPESRGDQSVRLFDTVRALVAARVAAGGPELLPEVDPAALLGPVREPVDWNPRDAAGDEEC